MPYYVRFTNSPLPELEEKVTYITTDQKKKTPNQWPNSPLLHSLVLSISAAPSLAALFLSHFVTPRLSLSFPRQRLGELSPLIQMRRVACLFFLWGFFCIGVCLPVCVCTSYVCVYMVDVARMVWSEEGVVGDPTNLLLGKHHLFTQNLPPSTPRLE